jgi:hypothetical protein
VDRRVEVVRGVASVPLQSIPHVLLDLDGRLLRASATGCHGWQPAQGPASPDLDVLEHRSHHLDLAYLPQFREVVEVDGLQLWEYYATVGYFLWVNFVQNEDVAEIAAVDRVRADALSAFEAFLQ